MMTRNELITKLGAMLNDTTKEDGVCLVWMTVDGKDIDGCTENEDVPTKDVGTEQFEFSYNEKEFIPELADALLESYEEMKG